MRENLTFESFEFNSRKEVIIGIDTTNKFLMKIQIIRNPNKAKNIQQEYEVIKHLNEQGSQTCPIAHEFGVIKKSEILSKLSESSLLDTIAEDEFQYIIQDFIPDNGAYSLADIIFTLIEQKKLGVYQGDIKPANIRFDSDKSICCFIDYDQSILLDKKQISSNNTNFLNFCSEYDKIKYGFGDWLRHFLEYTSDDIGPLFHNNSFNLEKTTVFKTQNTTNTLTGIYHSIDEKDIFIKGFRTMDTRTNLLNNVEFKPGEKVLDMGCNSGLLSWYLQERGCNTTGVDSDPYIIFASKMVSNILGKNIEYKYLDLDETPQLDKFDTIMLFSVLHHTKHIPLNAKKVSNACSRIILETRLTESGKQPIGGQWLHTSNWSFSNVQQLVSYCERIFDGFKLKGNLGIGDKNRYILEFVK